MDAALNNKALLHGLSTLVVTKSADQTDVENGYWIAFKQGNRPALNFIFEKYAALLYSYGASITKDSALVADCIQDIFFELWNKRESVASDVKFIKFYLIKSLRRKIVRRLYTDKKSLGDRNLPDDYSFEVEFSIEFLLIQEQVSNTLSAQLKQAVCELSKRQQEAIYLKFYESLSYEHIASVMGIDVKAAYNLVGKSVMSLRKVLSPPVSQ